MTEPNESPNTAGTFGDFELIFEKLNDALSEDPKVVEEITEITETSETLQLFEDFRNEVEESITEFTPYWSTMCLL